MPIPITGEIMLAYAAPMMDAIELIPEDKRDFVLWSGTFKNAEGEEKEASAMTPTGLAADVVTAMNVMTQFVAGEIQISPDLFEKLRATNDELSKKPLKEIADLGRERARETARIIDEEYSCGSLEGELDFGDRKMSKHVMATMVFTHVVHHRGQLYSMLRAVGVTPPGFLGSM